MKRLPASPAGPGQNALGSAVVLILLLAGCTPSAPSANPSPSVTIPTSATSAISATPSPIASPINTTAWIPYESKRYGFSLRHPRAWIVIPAERDWTVKADAGKLTSGGHEGFMAPAGDLFVAVYSTPAKDTPETLEGLATWFEQACTQTGSSCPGILDRAEPLCNERDCHSGLLMHESGNQYFQALFTGGDHEGQIVGVVVGVEESARQVAEFGGARRLLEGFLSTMDVCPARPDQPPGCP